MFKKIWSVFLNVVIVIVMIIFLAFFLIKSSVRSTGPTLEERMNSRKWKVKEAFDEYLIYNSNLNIKAGIKDGVFFPCPSGYDCERLVPDLFKTRDPEITFDQCGDTKECMDILKVVLLAYDIENFDEYLSARRINGSPDSQDMGEQPQGE